MDAEKIARLEAAVKQMTVARDYWYRAYQEQRKENEHLRESLLIISSRTPVSALVNQE